MFYLGLTQQAREKATVSKRQNKARVDLSDLERYKRNKATPMTQKQFLSGEP